MSWTESARLRTTLRTVVTFGLGYLADVYLHRPHLAIRVYVGAKDLEALFPAGGWVFSTIATVLYSLPGLFRAVLYSGSVGLALAVGLRVLLGARPGTARDPLRRLRDWLRRHRRVASWSPWWPVFALVPLIVLVGIGDGFASLLEGSVDIAGAFVDALLLTLAGKLAVRAVLSVTDADETAPAPMTRGETTFRAVAVTPRARAMVAGLGVASIGMAVGAALTSASFLFSPKMLAVMALYAVTMLALADWFRRASTIEVGVDGVLLRGTSKTAFYPYRDFDGVRVAGQSLVLARGSRSVVHLQLHGEDARRGEILAERIRRALERARSASPAELLAEASAAHVTEGNFARATLGAADFRQASLSRAQLWEVVEADGTVGAARAAAARALALQLEDGDRARLRVVAASCADPKIRVALEELAEDDEPTAAPARAFAR